VAGAAGILASFTEAGYVYFRGRVCEVSVSADSRDPQSMLSSKVYLDESKRAVFVGIADASCARRCG
jgi:hypothetical protein